MSSRVRDKAMNGIYHVTIRCINRQNMFLNRDDYINYLRAVAKAKEKYGFHLYTYCLMDNHVHLVIGNMQENKAKIFQSIGASFVRTYNDKYERKGHLFEKRYYCKLIRSTTQLYMVIKYIHENPVKANMVQQSSEYEWSGYRSFYSKEEEKKIREYVRSIEDKKKFEEEQKNAGKAQKKFKEEQKNAEKTQGKIKEKQNNVEETKKPEIEELKNDTDQEPKPPFLDLHELEKYLGSLENIRKTLAKTNPGMNDEDFRNFLKKYNEKPEGFDLEDYEDQPIPEYLKLHTLIGEDEFYTAGEESTLTPTDLQKLNRTRQVEEIWKLHDKGISLQNIGRMTGWSKSQVHYLMKTHPRANKV